MNRFWRRLSGWMGILALLFAQLAVSAYACPTSPVVEAGMTQSSVPSSCDRIDQEKVNLCEKHCHDSGQSQDSVAAIHGAFVPAFIAFVHMSPRGPSSQTSGEPALLHATAPPATIRNCCFRI